MGRDVVHLNPTRRSLLDRLKKYDEASWLEFYKIYSGLIYSVALKAGLSTTEAEEVLQETCISVAKKMPEFNYDPAIGSFKSWLLHTTQWRILDQFKKRRPQLTHFKDPYRTRTRNRTATIERIPDPAGFSLEKIWDKEWEDNIFEAAVEKVKRQIKAKQYQIFDLYILKKWPADKVATTMGVKTGFVYLVKCRVTRLLKKELKALQTKPLNGPQNRI